MSAHHHLVQQQQESQQQLEQHNNGLAMSPNPYNGGEDAGGGGGVEMSPGIKGGVIVGGVPPTAVSEVTVPLGVQHAPVTTTANDGQQGGGGVGVPSESELVLLCLDYLRDLRRSFSPEDLYDAEGIHSDYLTVAIYSLSRCLHSPRILTHEQGNDPWAVSSQDKADNNNNNNNNNNTTTTSGLQQKQKDQQQKPHVPCNPTKFPSIEEMTKEIIITQSQQQSQHTNNNNIISSSNEEEKRQDGGGGGNGEQQQNDNNNMVEYGYDDTHTSNAHRFYLLNGLASGPSLRGPLMLGEVVWAGLSGLQARTRIDAEQEMVTSPLFEQFVEAVKSKGFFKDTENETPKDDTNEEMERQIRQRQIYDERFAKVVSKFRTKLASKAQVEGVVTSATEWQQARRIRRIEAARERRDEKKEDPHVLTTFVSDITKRLQPSAPSIPTTPTGGGEGGGAPAATTHNPIDFEEAERLKAQGNAHMQKKEYKEAAASYTKALKLSPSGPNSHVYFSNRAAALLSMKKFNDAILDSERSLALKPNYGKAHARLGLAHFLLGDYRQAMEAYTVSLKYEPDNKSSKSYLEKAAKRLATGEAVNDQQQQQNSRLQTSSFSVVSEWDKGRKDKKESTITTSSSSQQQNNKLEVTSLPAFPPPDERAKADAREAEKFKVKGNSYMANRDYQQALDAYSAAIDLSPSGPQSHVYFSNRAAALCYLERYKEAEQDSVQSSQLKPTYGKAYARLGLSRFFLNNYDGAIQAYTSALQYDPDNAASKSYLAKAKLKLERQKNAEQPATTEADTRRLLEDPNMQTLARKALQNPSSELFHDPEMRDIAKKALKDPTMKGVLLAATQLDHQSSN